MTQNEARKLLRKDAKYQAECKAATLEFDKALDGVSLPNFALAKMAAEKNFMNRCSAAFDEASSRLFSAGV